MMTSKAVALRILDGTIAAVIGILMLSMAGFPIESISGLIDMSPPSFARSRSSSSLQHCG
jgi:divalent metal cation (Fe/Co/Zn/Cd) transporter